MIVARRFVEVIVSAGMLVSLLVVSRGGEDKPPAPPDALQDRFETPQPSWQREYTDGAITLQVQDRSERAAHGGRLSEHFQFETTSGNQFFVSYATPRVPVSDDLSVSVFVRANRGGVRIYGRVVLPADIDPETKAPSFLMVPGTIFDEPDRWQKLELVHILPAMERLARVLRASSRRPVSLDGAYVEQVVLNLLDSPGQSEVFVDDLEISPVPEEVLAAWSTAQTSRDSRAGGTAGALAAKRPGLDPGRVRMVRLGLLEKRGSQRRFFPWFPSAIDAPGANPVDLRLAGFDVLVDDGRMDPKRLKSLADGGVLLMKRLTGATTSEGPRRLLDQMNAYPLRQSVAFWHIGEKLGRQREIKSREEELARFRESLTAIRGLDDDVSHLVTANVEGELPLFSRTPSGLDIVGFQPRMWASAQSFLETYEYLRQRRLLAVSSNLGGLFWAWIQATTPPEVVRNIWGASTPPAWGVPPVQPEQLRLMTYLALSEGYRGLGFLGDADLTRAEGPGRALLIEMSFLNLEIDICEQILAENDKPIPLYNLFDHDPLPIPTNATQQSSKKPPKLPELKPHGELRGAAVALRDRKGSLLLVGDYTSWTQFQPGQLAADTLVITPILPAGSQAFEITPGEVRVLAPERVPGGRQFSLDEFDTTSLILCTGDLGLYERARSIVDGLRHKAVPLAVEQAEIMHKAVTETHGRLAADGHPFRSKVDLKMRRLAGIENPPPDVDDLLAKSMEHIKSAREASERQDYSVAWFEAQRAKRTLRVVMKGYWDQAWDAFTRAAESINPDGPKPEDEAPKRVEIVPKVKLDAPLQLLPIACPPSISFYTLPEHYIWVDWIKGRPGYRFGRNRVPSGDFEDPDALTADGWVDVSYQVEGIVAKITTVSREEANGKALAKNRPNRDQLAPDNANSTRVVKLQVLPEKQEDLDSILPKFFDFPVAAIRSPPIPVEANNLIRISVLVKRPYQSANGLGGIIVRDSIGGEQFQYRTSSPLPSFSRVVLFRKAPADGNFTVTLGLAGYAEAYFDDLRVEVIEGGNGDAEPNLDQERRPGQIARSPRLPAATLPAAASRPTESRPR
jgi:hypothetical protein